MEICINKCARVQIVTRTLHCWNKIKLSIAMNNDDIFFGGI